MCKSKEYILGSYFAKHYNTDSLLGGLKLYMRDSYLLHVAVTESRCNADCIMSISIY